MADQLVCGWDEFETHASNTFKQLWEDTDFTDVTLVTEDHIQIKAHKLVLSSASVFFGNILTNNPHHNPLIFLKDIKNTQLRMILEFIYFGQCKVRHDDLELFLSTGKELKINGLIKNTIKQNFSEGSEETSLEDINIKEIQNTNIIINTANTDVILENENEVEKDVQGSSLSFDKIFEVKAESKMNEDVEIEQRRQKKIESMMNKIQHNMNYKFFSLGLFSCDECPNKLTNFNHLKMHKKQHHNGLFYECDQCDYKSLRIKDGLLSHKMSMHEGLDYEGYTCDHCEYRAARASHIKRHKQLKHEAAKFQCKTCNYTGTSLINLGRHTQVTHEGVRFSCDKCQLKFTSLQSLSRHNQIAHE